METSERPTERRYAGRHRIVDHTTPSVPGYDVVEPIGQGGSGAVWSATDATGATVAIKVVPAVDAADALVELAVLGRITDPHLVRLHEATALPSGDVALVLDHLAGGTLGAAVRARGHLAPGEAVTVLSPIASTLGRLHGIGVVHGDVSPDNVLLDLEGRPFLADLGVARIVGEQLAELRGTEGFIAPEVAVGGAPTQASDTYALGALAWFVLTGEAPGPAVIRGRLGERVAGLPADLVSAVEGALRSRPEDRPDADALAVAIFESAAPEPLVLVTGGDDVSLLTRRIRAAARASSDGGAAAKPAPGHVRARDFARRRLPATSTAKKAASSLLRGVRTVAPFVVVVGIMAAVALGVVAWSSGRDDARASTPSTSSEQDVDADARERDEIERVCDGAGHLGRASGEGRPTSRSARPRGCTGAGACRGLVDRDRCEAHRGRRTTLTGTGPRHRGVGRGAAGQPALRGADLHRAWGDVRGGVRRGCHCPRAYRHGCPCGEGSRW